MVPPPDVPVVDNRPWQQIVEDAVIRDFRHTAFARKDSMPYLTYSPILSLGKWPEHPFVELVVFAIQGERPSHIIFPQLPQSLFLGQY